MAGIASLPNKLYSYLLAAISSCQNQEEYCAYLMQFVFESMDDDFFYYMYIYNYIIL